MAKVHGEVRGGSGAPEIGIAQVAAERDVAREAVRLHEEVEDIVVRHGAADEEEGPAFGRERCERFEDLHDAFGGRHDAERDGDRTIGRQAERAARSGALRARGRDDVMREKDGARLRALAENRAGHERRVRDDRLRGADHPGGHRVEPRVEVPDGDARAAAAALGEGASPGAVRPLELARVVVLAPAVEVRRGEEVVEDELVENDDGGSPAFRIEERLDRRSVQRVVADLDEEHVVLRRERASRVHGLVRDDGENLR